VCHETSAVIVADDVEPVLHEQSGGRVTGAVRIERALLDGQARDGIRLVATSVDMFVVHLAAKHHGVA